MLPLVLSGGLIPGQTRNGLESIQMNLVGAINFTDYERLLNQEAVNFDVEEVYNNLTQIATLQANMVQNNATVSNQKKMPHMYPTSKLTNYIFIHPTG